MHLGVITAGTCVRLRRFAVMALVACFAIPASAQTTDPDRAMALFQEAREAYDRGDHKTSVRKLRKAVTLVDDSPTIAKLKVTIARRLLELDEPREALKELESIDLKALRRARKLRRVVEDDMAKIRELLLQPVKVVFETFPSGASIRLNAGTPKKTPLSLTLSRGDVKVTIRMPGYEDVRETINVKGTRTMRRRWTLEQQMSQLTVLLMNQPTWDGAPTPVVRVDDTPFVAGMASVVAPGKHVISCTFPGHPTPTKLTVNVPAGRGATVRCPLPKPMEKPGSWKQPVGWVSVTGGTAAVAAGIGLLASWAVETHEYQSPQYEVRSSKPLAGGIATGIGAGLVGLGTYLLLSD